jgi:uncharacterized membrane protein YidH (DUF202 family)
MKDSAKLFLAWFGATALIVFGVAQLIIALTETQSITGSDLIFERFVFGSSGMLTLVAGLAGLLAGVMFSSSSSDNQSRSEKP